MPVTPPSITAAILAAGPSLTGPSWTLLSTVIGMGVSSWALVPSNVVLQGVTAGVVGSGKVTGKMFVIPAPLPVSAAALAILFGNTAPSVALAVGLGVANAFNASALYQGASVGVGTGTDVSKVSFTNGPSLTAALSAAASATSLTGVNVPLICAALGPGIAALILTGTGVGATTGPGGPLPAGGTSLSWVS